MTEQTNVAKRVRHADRAISAESVVFTFSDKSQATIKADMFPAPVTAYAAMFGLARRIGEAYNKAESVEQAKEFFDAIVKQLQAGDWESDTAQSGDLAQAVVNVAAARGKQLSLDKVRQMLAAYSDEQTKAVKSDPAIKAAIKAIQAERAKGKADKAETSSALADLLG